MQYELQYPSYVDIHNACVRIAKSIIEHNTHIDLIVGITRGGLLPAVILSHLLNIPMSTLEYSSKKGNGDGLNYTNKFKSFGQKTLLFFDEISDSSLTLKEITEHYTNEQHLVYTAVLYYKNITPTFHQPNFIWRVIPSDYDWIHFPWEHKQEYVQV